MAKIKIKGCGYCSKSKGCEIKKDFRNLASKYSKNTEIESSWYHGELNYSYNGPNEFKLICPFGKRKYTEGDEVVFSLEVIKFENNRIKVKGNIICHHKNDKWVIGVNGDEWYRIKPYLNENDIDFFEKISNIYDPGLLYYMVFVSKEKYITQLIK